MPTITTSFNGCIRLHSRRILLIQYRFLVLLSNILSNVFYCSITDYYFLATLLAYSSMNSFPCSFPYTCRESF